MPALNFAFNSSSPLRRPTPTPLPRITGSSATAPFTSQQAAPASVARKASSAMLSAWVASIRPATRSWLASSWVWYSLISAALSPK